MATLKQGKKFLELIEDFSDEHLQRFLGSGLLTDLLGCPNPEFVDRRAFQQILALAIPKPKGLLDFIGTVEVPATTKKFVAKEHLVKDTSNKARVKISYFGDNFTGWFLEKIEKPITGTTLRYYKLKRYSVDRPIIAELGGETKAETTLAEMFSLMEKQANGESGALLTNGYANIFYVRDVNAVLRAVSCYWRSDGWYMDADSVDNPYGWLDGCQVFSRNS